MENIKEIRAFVNGISRQFKDDDPGTTTQLSLSTREHGDMVKDEPGQEDIRKAREIAKAVRAQFPNVKVELDYCDEWTYILITEKNHE